MRFCAVWNKISALLSSSVWRSSRRIFETGTAARANSTTRIATVRRTSERVKPQSLCLFALLFFMVLCSSVRYGATSK